MQPLDTAVYAPFKTYWQDAHHHYLQSHLGKAITKYQFTSLFSEAWLKTMIPANIISGFRTCGVYPFNPKAVLDHYPCVSKNNNPKSTDGNNPTDGDLPSGSDLLPKRSRKKCPSKSTSSLPSTHLRDKPGTSAAIAESSVASPIQDSVLLCYHPDDDEYQCNECFGTYKEDKEMGNGAEWVQCGCGQWIYEDCVSNTVADSDGTELMW